MSSKPIQYLSYSMPLIAIILFAVFKGNFFLYIIPAVGISFLLKLWALSKAQQENKDFHFLGVLKKETKKGAWVFIVLIGLASVDALLSYFIWFGIAK